MDRDKAGQELDEFYGDSDADENPFEPNLPSPSDGDVFDPSNTPHLSDVSVRDRLLNTGSQEIAHTSQPHMGANVAHGLHWQGLPGSIIPAAGGHNSFPPLAGTNAAPERPNQTLSEMVARRTRPLHDKPLAPGIEIVGTEVETETEGETECDHSASDRDGEKTSTAEEWVTNEQDWTVPIDVQLKAAQVGKADPHALRLLLRKAGFVPASRRKDIWRLLILGRVEPGMRTSTSTGFPDSPSEILALEAAILCTDLDLDNQRVVRVDVERTRPALEQFKRPRVKNLLTRVLTHHCKTHGLGYKQGMHEVLAPFVALSDPELPTSDISLCYGAFIKRFLPYAFNKDEEFLSLQICFRLFRILLLYHHPRLCRFLDQYQLQPELYATPWFLTLFSNSLDLSRLYEIWDFYLYWGDPALHHFVVLAFVIRNAEVILQAEEANLPETMCRLSVGMRSVEEIRGLLRTAKDLMLNTPKSFRKILRSALYANLSQSQMNLVLGTLQVSSCIPVSAEEVISYILHKNPHRQLDQESDQESIGHEEDNRVGGATTSSCVSRQNNQHHDFRGDQPNRRRRSPSPQRLAERAAMRSLRGHRQYIIMDCRPRGEFEACRLAPALHLDPDLLVSPDDLDAKLKEFMPLQGMAHFCLVGAGGGSAAASGHKSRAAPSDLSGEAMGLRPTSGAQGDRSKTDASGGTSSSGEALSKSDRLGEGNFSFKADGSSVSRERDGGFSWMGGLSRALARGQEHMGKDGEEVGREEDVQVARFVLMLLQYNFPFISHVRGDMSACMQELSAQALDESQLSNSGRHDALLDGLLIGTDADRMREELTYRSPEKKTEGIFAGFPKWPKGLPDHGNGASVGPEDGERGRTATWISSHGADRMESSIHVNRRSDRTPSRGRGGMGRRGTEDSGLKGSSGADHAVDQGADHKASTKRRLFSGVLDRFDRGDNGRNGAGNGGGGGGDGDNATDGIGTLESPRWQDNSFPTEARRWLTPGRSRAAAADGSRTRTKSEAPVLDPNLLGVPASDNLMCMGLPSGPLTQGETPRSASGTWVKPAKSPHPERFARFLGKMLGVRDDALPEGAAEADVETHVTEERRQESNRSTSRSRGANAPDVAGRVKRENSGSSTAQRTHSGRDNTAASTVPTSSEEATGGSRNLNPPSPVTATAVYPATTISTATAEVMPVAVAVAVPVTEGQSSGADVRQDRRSDRPSSRPRRSQRVASATPGPRGAIMEEPMSGSRSGEASSRVQRDTESRSLKTSGTAVSISEWVANEQRESGGPVRLFSAQRVVEGKVQKRCRLAVSPKNMTQFDDIQEGTTTTSGARGIISEHRGLRHLSRITSRKKHADLIVFHFKSRSGSSASVASGSKSHSSGSRAESSSRRTRQRPASLADNESGSGQPDVLFYLMKDHAECLRLVKENYRRVTQGGGSSSSRGTSSITAVAGPSPASLSVRRSPSADSWGVSSATQRERSGGGGSRSTPRAAAGAAAGAAGLVVGAAAGVAVGAAAGVAVGAAFLAGHRRGSQDSDNFGSKSVSPTRGRRRGAGGSDTSGRDKGNMEVKGSSRGWIPIETEPTDAQESGGGRRGSNSSATSARRGSSGSGYGSGSGEHSRDSRKTGGSGARASSSGRTSDSRASSSTRPSPSTRTSSSASRRGDPGRPSWLG